MAKSWYELDIVLKKENFFYFLFYFFFKLFFLRVVPCSKFSLLMYDSIVQYRVYNSSLISTWDRGFLFRFMYNSIAGSRIRIFAIGSY